MIISLKNLIILITLSSLIVSQDLEDIDIRLSNLEFEKVQLPLEQLHSKYPQNIDILLRLTITHHYLSESAMKKSLDKKNASKSFEYKEKEYHIKKNNHNILKGNVIK